MLLRTDVYNTPQTQKLNQPQNIFKPSFNGQVISAQNRFDTFNKVSFTGASTPLDSTPLNTFLSKVKPYSLEEAQKVYAADKQFLQAAQEISELGYTKISFPQLRETLLKEDGSYNMQKLATLISLATGNDGNGAPVKSVREQHKSPNWLYENSMVEYVNIRSLGVNNPDGSVKRLGNVLDAIVYALQSRSGGFHLAPFHESAFNDQVYVPKDTYSVDRHIQSKELASAGLNHRNQIKLFADVCHSIKNPIALFYDTLPHTGDISVNYLDMPEAARWISLDSDKITQNSKTFDSLKPYFEESTVKTYEEFSKVFNSKVKPALNIDSKKIYAELDKSLSMLHHPENYQDNFKNQASIELMYAIKSANPGARSDAISSKPKDFISGKEEQIKAELFKLTLRKAVVLGTHLAEKDIDIEMMRKNSEIVWSQGKSASSIPSAEAAEMVESKDSTKIAKQIRQIVKQKVGKEKPSYEDIQKQEENWDTSIKKQLMHVDNIYNMPVGAWNGLLPELVGFHKEYKYPIFSCRGNSQTNFRYQQSNEFKDVAWKMFGTLARRNFNHNDGTENKAAIKEWEEAVEFWLQTGFDGLRLDQTDHLFTQPYDYSRESGKTLEEYLRDKDYAYDTILPRNIKSLLDSLRKAVGPAIPAFAENMMYHPMEQAQRAFKEMQDMGAQSITGNFQFYDSFQKLTDKISVHNALRQTKGADEFVMSTIECHDNQLTGKDAGPQEYKGIGTGPASKAMDGLTNIRIRFLLDSIGMPYITTQALMGIGSDKVKDHQIQDTLVKTSNLTFDKQPPQYQVGNQTFSYNDFRHNFSDFINRPEIKAIMKGGQVTNISPSEKTLAFIIRNKGSESLLVVANSGDQNEANVNVNVPSGFNNASPDVVEYVLDGSNKAQLEPQAAKLNFADKKVLKFDELKKGEIKIYKFNEL